MHKNNKKFIAPDLTCFSNGNMFPIEVKTKNKWVHWDNQLETGFNYEHYKNYKEINSSQKLNEFEKFLYNRIKKDFPTELIEDYKFWSRNSFSSYIQKVILSDNLHIQNV